MPRDPLLIIHPTPADEYYKSKPKPPMGWPKRKTPTIEQVDKAHDNLKKLVLEKDRIIRQGNQLAEVLQKERRWRKALIAAFVATWITLIAVLKFLIPYAIKGMMK